MDLRTSVELACILEATARKPGNVRVDHDFDDLTYGDLLVAGIAVAPILACASRLGVGRCVLDAVLETRKAAGSNANLGIILLLAPLCAADPDEGAAGVRRILAESSVEDARLVYRAIRKARPGGMGTVPAQDVAGEPTVSLVEAMRLAASRDTIARQYANGFSDVFDLGVPVLRAAIDESHSLEDAIVWCHLCWMARYPDSLIARKCGHAEAQRSSEWARQIVARLSRGDPPAPSTALTADPSVAQLDTWLRSAGHSRNPGTSADLVAASLFWAFRTDLVDPRRVPFSARQP